MDVRTFFRGIIPGYALVIPLFFYLRYLICFNFGTQIITAIITVIASGVIGVFLEWIVETGFHSHRNWEHPVIGRRIRTMRKILGLRMRPQRLMNSFLLRNIRGHYLRGFLNFVLNSHKKFESHRERHTFLASRTHGLSASILGIILGNAIGLVLLMSNDWKIGFLCIIEHADLILTIFFSIVTIVFFGRFYLICRNDLIAYEKMLISRYREDFRGVWFLRTRG